MKSLKIEYDGNKLVMLEIDGHRIEHFNSIRLVHDTPVNVPQLHIGFPVAGKDCIIPPDVDQKSMQSVQKRFGEGHIPFGGFPGSIKEPHVYEEVDTPDTPDDVA